MKDSVQPMSTARGVALLRAIETARPDGERLFADPYARAFVNPVTRATTGLMVRAGLLDRLLPAGTIDFALVREVYIQDVMEREIWAGLAQLVILGAGFDTRAYRMPAIGDLPVFEVDHPATQAAKRRALAGVAAAMPAGHRFVSVDFNTDDLGERLAAAGYDASLRTLFVWQGVIMYLTAEGVDATLGFIAKHSPPGSVVVFDYFEGEAFTSGFLGLVTRAMGERMTFAIPAGTIVPFLERRGFTDVVSAGAAELRRLYLTGSNARRKLVEGAGIATAIVSSP